MGVYSSFEEMDIYKLAREIAKDVWDLIKFSPLGSDYELRNQINASSGSIMDNIAEGYGRGGNKEFVNFLGIARGSLTETRSQIIRALDREHISEEEFTKLRDKTINLENQISKFINYLKSSNRKGSKFD